MKKEVMEIWVEALRSGKYEQGQSALNDDNKFCCLGVLCDISKVGKWEDYGKTKKKYKAGEWSDPYYLPRDVQKWSGINGNKGRFNGINLPTLNDADGKTFKEIADIIEANWEKL